MGIFKVLGGIAAGVGVVAVAPVFGAVGAVTVAGAAVGATVGAVAGGVASSIDEDDKNSSYRAGERSGKAENAQEVDNLKKTMEEASKRFEDYKDYETFLISCYAVGISVANCDGEIAKEELEELESFLQGETFNKYPESFKNTLKELKNSPPTFRQAMSYVEELDKENWDQIDDIINFMIEADGYIHEKESAYKESWRRYKAS